MTDSREIKTMRYMEWERVKGSLRAILASYWDWDYTKAETGSFWYELDEMVKQFIKDFGESAGLD